MADVAISELTALGAAPATNDLLVVVDVSDFAQAPSGTTKSMTVANLFTAPTFTTSVTVTGTLAVSGDVAVATNKLTVAASTGNTAIAGTLTVTGLATLTAGVVMANNAYLQALTTGAVQTVVLGIDASDRIILDNSSLGVTCNGGFAAAGGLVVTGDALVSARLGVGTLSPATSAAIDITSTTGALLLSRMNTAARDALTAVNGMVIYNSQTNAFQGYQGGSWQNLI